MFVEKWLEGVANCFFAAGNDTVRNGVEWLFHVLAADQELQAKVYGEIEAVVGQERKATLADKLAMPFTEAVIMEGHRFGSIIPTNLPHVASEDIRIKGHFIPKGTHVMANLYAYHFDADYWKEPQKFDPTRFLDAEGNFVKRESFVPFGLGKRACPGESLAHLEVFLYVVNLIQKFKFTSRDGRKIDLSPCMAGFNRFIKVENQLILVAR